MNQKDKKELSSVLKQIKGVSTLVRDLNKEAQERKDLFNIVSLLEKLLPTIEEHYDREYEKYEEGSDKWKESYKGEVVQEMADNLERAKDNLEDCIHYLQAILDE
jgi:hypothetical protein